MARRGSALVCWTKVGETLVPRSSPDSRSFTRQHLRVRVRSRGVPESEPSPRCSPPAINHLPLCVKLVYGREDTRVRLIVVLSFSPASGETSTRSSTTNSTKSHFRFPTTRRTTKRTRTTTRTRTTKSRCHCRCRCRCRSPSRCCCCCCCCCCCWNSRADVFVSLSSPSILSCRPDGGSRPSAPGTRAWDREARLP